MEIKVHIDETKLSLDETAKIINGMLFYSCEMRELLAVKLDDWGKVNILKLAAEIQKEDNHA